MRCFYEVLEVQRDADDATLKKAYRSLALKWHPDKNAHQAEEAHENFQEIQNAFEVLSDPQERAWYDSHREQILSSGGRHQAGGTGDAGGGESPDDNLEFSKYRNKGAYKGYTDAADGFYRVFEALFHRIAEQEAAAFERQTSYMPDLRAPAEAPAFGSSHAGEPEVKAFYNYWINFQTLKDFAWEDAYNPAGAPSRKIRRVMEDENSKRRRAAKAAYVAEIRSLVEFMRKKDQRMLRFQKERAEKRAAAEAEAERKRQAEREAKRQAALQYQPADWIRASEEEAVDDLEGEDDDDAEVFECIVCDKVYKTAKALLNHENSKKHKEQLKHFRRLMQEEDMLEALDDLALAPADAS